MNLNELVKTNPAYSYEQQGSFSVDASQTDTSREVSKTISIQHAPLQFDDGWHKGSVKINNRVYDFEAKVYGTGSKYGIKNGRISKLNIYDESGNYCASYDRMWMTRAKNDEVKIALALILNEFN